MKKKLTLVTVIVSSLFFYQQAIAQFYDSFTKNGMKVHVFTSNPVIFESTSVLLEGMDEVILVDAQFSKEDAQQVVDLINATGKELSMIYISGPNPDFYFGLDHISKQFPNVKILSTAYTAHRIDATKDEKMIVWAPSLGSDAPEKIIVPAVINDDHFMLEDKIIEIKKIDDSEQYSFLWIPSIRTILGGAYVSNEVHLWVADAQTKKDRAKWMSVLEMMDNLYPDYTIPAYFTAGESNLEKNAPIEFTEGYLVELENVLDNSTNSQEVIEKMQTLYPDLKGVSNLQTTAGVLKGEIPWKTINASPAVDVETQMNIEED